MHRAPGRGTRLRTTAAAAIVSVVASGLLVGSAPAQAAPVLREGFLLQTISAGLPAGDPITDFGFLPDESLLVTGKNGSVMWTPLTGTPRKIATLSVNANGDIGLLGIAVAPDYATSRTIYTARTVPPGEPGSGANGLLRLSKWRVVTAADGTPTGLADERTVVQTTADSTFHSMSGIVAAEDGTLWVSIGDSAEHQGVHRVALRALDLNDAHGKLLHVNQDGTGVPSNPFYNASAPRSVRSLVYASGFRSPFRFTLEPGTGRPIVGDVGWYTTEEIDVVSPGNNYGWPCWEGNQPTPQYRDLPECAGTSTANPLWQYGHNNGGSVTGGVLYTGTSYPEQYRGRYFFGDYSFRKIWTLRTNERGELVTPPEPDGFGTEIGRPVKFDRMPTGGDIVFADISNATIRRLVYAPGNQPPQPVINSSVHAATRTVTFDASQSTDPNGDKPLTYRWNFGDGTPAADGPAVVTHTYPASPDQFTATVTVTDPLLAAGTANVTVYPGNHGPVLSLQPPASDTRYAVGDTITATASATDPEDGPLTVSWSTSVVHCTGVGICHDHPGQDQVGPDFRLTFAGHPGHSRLEITATATDSRGAVARQTFVAQPKQRRVTIQSTFPAPFTLGEEQTTSALFTVGTNLSIVAPELAQDGVASFERWGDGNTNRLRQLVVPDADTTLPVTYLTPIDRRWASDAWLRSVVGNPVNNEQGDSTIRWRDHAAGRVYWAPGADVHFVIGAIREAFFAHGGHAVLGAPTTDEQYTADGTGRWNHFQRNWSIFWSPGTGAHEVHGAIRDRYAALGFERSALGLPTTDEQPAGDGVGRVSHFQGGDIFWSPGTGAHEVHGAIRLRWLELGGVRSALGYPTSDEFSIPGGRRSNFARGLIWWRSSTGPVVVLTQRVTW